MIIRLGLMDKDDRYTARLASYMEAHNTDEIHLELFLFSGMDDYRGFLLGGGHLDILLAGIPCVNSEDEIESQTILAYLTEDKTMVGYEGHETVCKYRKGSEIYRAVLGLAGRLYGRGGQYETSARGNIRLFVGAAGGVGCTTAAVGCAAHMVKAGKSTVYVSFQQSAQPRRFFGTCGLSASDVHYSYQEWLRMDSGDDADAENGRLYRLQLKLKSMLAQDPETGVDCFDCANLLADTMDMSPDEMRDQVKALASQYDECIVDMDGTLNSKLLGVLRIATCFVLVNDGTERGNFCANRLLASLKVLNDSGEALLNRDIGMLYTRFGSDARDLTDHVLARVIGKIPRYNGASEKTIVQEIVRSGVFGVLEK